MATYCGKDDLLLGDIPIGSGTRQEAFLQDATDEINVTLGGLYVVPFDVSEAGPLSVRSRTFIKRAAAFLATGRMIMAVDAGGEDTTLHAYGLSLVREALGWLAMITSGQITLDGAEPTPTNSDGNTGPTIKNTDAVSSMDAFYDRMMNPEKDMWVLPYRDWAPGSNPRGEYLGSG